MSELIEILEKMVELLEENDYPIDNVIMGEECANHYIDSVRYKIERVLNEIPTIFPIYKKYRYRRVIVSTDYIIDVKDLFPYEGEMWEVFKTLPYTFCEREVFLRKKQ